MIQHPNVTAADLRNLIRHGKILFAGNRRLRIYGLLSCKTGKRMKMGNRVFFESEDEAIRSGYRPCGHCMRMAFVQWKNSSNNRQ